MKITYKENGRVYFRPQPEMNNPCENCERITCSDCGFAHVLDDLFRIENHIDEECNSVWTENGDVVIEEDGFIPCNSCHKDCENCTLMYAANTILTAKAV